MFSLGKNCLHFSLFEKAPLLWFVVPTSFSDEEVKELGLTENLIRLSCGLEDLDDLIKDVDQALNGLFT